jgi:glycosyltransferase involved in cell wall biosynthesis
VPLEGRIPATLVHPAMTPVRHRILFLNHVARVSGAERSLLDILRHLDRARFVGIVAAPQGGELSALVEHADVPFHPLPLRRIRKSLNPLQWTTDLLNIARVTTRLARLIRRQSIDLVHSNSSTAQLYGGMAARWCGVPCVWHNRDLVNLGPLGRWLGRSSSCVIAISECVRRQAEGYAGGARKVKTIYNGIDLSAMTCRGDRLRIREELGIPPRALAFGMIGQQVPWKRHRVFIETAALLAATLPDARFVIAGDDRFGDHRTYQAELLAHVTELGLDGKVLFTGYRPDIAPLLECLDVLIHPATREPLGRVILEAMAMDKPVVAVDACGPGEIIRNGVDGILTATGQPEELAAASLSLIQEPGLANRIGEAARRRVEERFNIRHSIREVEAVYEELLRRKDRSCA